ncbi:unnamed protein product [Echinostoma caproni]|uniref:Uncharacterized protein n=1 Tax=Echinostoma caproni TaxID=27848 RepID=A0A183ACE7_9TREM|nr:unnamed protein product [Echinostoma caproni]
MKFNVLISLIVVIILAIVSLATNPFIGISGTTSTFRALVAFNFLGLFLAIAAFILFVILFFTCEAKYGVLMVTIVVFTGVSRPPQGNRRPRLAHQRRPKPLNYFVEVEDSRYPFDGLRHVNLKN